MTFKESPDCLCLPCDSFARSRFLFTRRNLFSYYTILPCGITSLAVPARHVCLSGCFVASRLTPPPVVFLKAGRSFDPSSHTHTHWMKCRLRCDSLITHTHLQAGGTHMLYSWSPVINPLHTLIHPVIKVRRPTQCCGPSVPTIRAFTGRLVHELSATAVPRPPTVALATSLRHWSPPSPATPRPDPPRRDHTVLGCNGDLAARHVLVHLKKYWLRLVYLLARLE